MATVKKIKFANGTTITAPEDLTLESSSNKLPAYANDGAYTAENPLQDGSIYLNTTLKTLRLYTAGAWRTGIVQENATDPTKTVSFDLNGCSTGADNILDFNSTADRTYTFPDVSATVVLTLGAQELQSKTIKDGFLDGTKIRNNALDVEAAGALTVGASMGANTMTLGGAASTVSIPGNLTVSGTTTTVDTVNLDVKDKNILVNKGGNDALSEGSGLTVDRTGTKGSLIYKSTASSKFAAGDLGSEKNLAVIDDITATNLTGTILPSKGGTGVSNNDSATLTRTGNFDLNITTTASSAVTMPTTGTLATLSGSETLLNKNVSSTAALTGALKLPVGNSTTERPSGTAATLKGMIRYNDTDDVFEGYNELSGWASIGGGGTTDRVTQASHGFVVGDVLWLNGSTYAKAIATAANTAEVIGVVSRVIDASTFEVTLSGEVSGLSGLMAGEVYFLSASTAGLLTTTEPTTIGYVSVPIGIASSATTIYVAPKRGVVIGATNARTQISLLNNATTTIQDVSAYDAGELTGWVSITATTPLRFYVAAQFSKNGAANNYNVSYQVSGDTPPTGFVVTATAAGLLQITLPSIAGFALANINYALNAPAVGTSFPLTVDSSGVQFQKIVPKDTTGISVRNAADSATNVFISDAGLVGIGTTSPQENLHIRSATPRIRFEDTDGSGAYSVISGNSTNGSLVIAADVTNVGATSEILFQVDNVARMSIPSSGNVAIGPSEMTTSGCVELNSGGSGDRSTFIDFHASGLPGALDFSARLIRVAGSTGSFDIINVTNGVRLAANGTSWAAISDERQKKNIKDLEYGLDQIKAIRPVRFDYNAEESEESKRIGFVAQELLPVVKEAVYGSEHSEYSVSPTDLIPVMIKAIQELKEELDAAKAEIAALKGV